jgi:hypothetical protein
MSDITGLREVQKVRTPAGWQWSRSAILPDGLDALYCLLAAPGEILSKTV